jgi:hypothetical protein
LETRRLFFILLSYINIWNLGCRTNNTEGIRLSHLFWQMDALRIDFGITKTNQSGDKPETRLLLTNLALPFICPVTNLALYLATLSGNAKDNELLFEGGQQASHFQKRH